LPVLALKVRTSIAVPHSKAQAFGGVGDDDDDNDDDDNEPAAAVATVAALALTLCRSKGSATERVQQVDGYTRINWN
jgi:hypothetical protein